MLHSTVIRHLFSEPKATSPKTEAPALDETSVVLSDVTNSTQAPKSEAKDANAPGISASSLSATTRISKGLSSGLNTSAAASCTAPSGREIKDTKDAGSTSVGYSVSWTIPYSELTFEKQIADGVFGKVYKGTWQGKSVAIKQANSDPKLLEECEFLQDLQDLPFVVQCYGSFTKQMHDSCSYGLVMEYLPGGDVHDWIVHSTKIGIEYWKSCYKILENTAFALAELHSRYKVHADPKWENIMYLPGDNIKLVDFGCSFSLSPGISRSKQAKNLGTLRFLAPEAYSEHYYGYKTDTYAFGIMMFIMLTKSLPWNNYMPQKEVAAKVASGARPPIPSTCPSFFSGLIKRCWEQNPEDRPTMAQLHSEIQAERIARNFV